MNELIQLSGLKNGTPGISPIEGANLYENCIVQLHQSGHPERVALKVEGKSVCEFTLQWEDGYNEQLKRTYGDEQSVTERAAVGISVLLVLKLTDYTIIERSRKGTGFDYLLGNQDDEYYNPKARLEVSGIGNETSVNSVYSRYQAKFKQTDKSDDSMLPAYISIVEFSMPKVLFDLKGRKG